MNINELIEALEELRDAGTETIEVHFQQNYPLKARVVNVRQLGTAAAIALGAGDEYGSRKAWDDEEEDCCECCGASLDCDEELDAGLCTDCDGEEA
jgi:hypothetical protein